ncbi:PepSY-associated TM helix domain-containing protein [Lysobacter sp. HA18]
MTPTTNKPRTASRNTTYRWVRQIHLWVGAWGALAALLFGFTGLFLANRMGDSALPQGKSNEVGTLTLEVPADVRANPKALAAWLRTAYHLDATGTRGGKPEGGRVQGRDVQQPAKWSLTGGNARHSWTFDYVPGNATAELKRSEQSPLAALLRLHKGVGGGLFWRVLQTSFAIGMILLGVSGIWMWARGRTARQMAFSVMGLATLVFVAALALALA